MSRLRVLALAVTLLAAVARPQAPAGDTEPPSLFDGHSLAGWDGDPRFWSVEDGAIVGRSTRENPCTETTYLIWRAGEVRDFELALQFKIEGGNSGVQFRSRDAGRWQVEGYQADIEDGPSWTGCLYEQGGRGVVATRGQRVVLGTGAPQRTAFADAGELLARVRSQEWNDYVIRAAGERIEIEINGVRTVEVVDRDPVRARASGLVALQLHQGPPMRVAFRDFRLRELPSEPQGPIASTLKAETAGPQWIWMRAQATDGERAAFTMRFAVPEGAQRAVLRGAGDDHLAVYIDGRRAAASDEWWTPFEIDVTSLVMAGEHTLAAFGENGGSVAALWLELEVLGERGRIAHVVTDATWRAHPWSDALPNAERLTVRPVHESGTAPHVFGPLGTEPWESAGRAMRGEDEPAAEPESRALPGDELQLLPGFRAELLYSVPKPEQGSWVSMCADERGRLYVSDQYGGLYRVTPPAIGDTSARTHVERVPIDLGEAQGLCWAYDSLYAVVSSGGKHASGLYRVRDTDGDDDLDLVACLREFDGDGEHGPHGVALGPDGQFWITGGNHTKLPEPIDTSRVPRIWAEDHLLPVIEDPNGHAVGIRAPGGWIVRTDKDGATWELWAIGFRNAYDLAFDETGELFTFDSDMEWDTGLSWYKPTRVLHVVSGADFGWRSGSANWPADYPDTLPSVCDLGLSSPTGVVFGTNATFPPKYRHALYALDWAYGTIYAVHMEPKGASFVATSEKFATGKPFPVCDAVIGRDGSMYVVTGGRNAQSGLYRITADGTESYADWTGRAPPAAMYARRDVERVHGQAHWRSQDVGVAEMCAKAAHGDRFTSTAARIVVEGLVYKRWRDHFARAEPAKAVRLAVAAVRSAPEAARADVLALLASLRWSEIDGADRLRALRVYELFLMRCAPIAEGERAAFVQQLGPLFPSGDARVDRELAMLLCHLDAPGAVEPLVAVMESDAAQEEKIWAAYCLRVAKAGWTLDLRRRFFAAMDALRATAKGGFSFAKYLDVIRQQVVDSMSDDERRELAAAIALQSPPTSAAAAPAARFVRAWKRDEVDALVREPLRARSFENGRTAFAKATCLQCHRIANEGGATGPDLTGAGSRFSRLDLVETILEPSKVLSDQYQDLELVTRDGDLYVGRIESEQDGVVRLRRLPPGEELVELDAAEIASRRPHPLSRMPSGLLDVLTDVEVLDLFAFVLSGANAADPAFTGR